MGEHKIIGLTGAMASGKNEAARILTEAGCAVIDADVTAHEALETVKAHILERFLPLAQKIGIELTTPDGSILRRNLGKIVFSSKKDLQALEDILYPEVTRRINEFIDKNSDKNVVINAIALHKTPLIDRCNFFIFVDAPIVMRFFRVLKRDALPCLQIMKRFYAQKKLYTQYLLKNVDIYRVDNNKTPADLKRSLQNILALIR